ncbi:MAG: aldo/keto reductase [Bryobacteraceae bacterium]|nr:aldo/keto reductase [Bryobacteraceae bacterium]
MATRSSRRDFLAAGLLMPAAGLASVPQPTTSASGALQAGGLSYGVLGRTGLKVTRVAFGCMITSDPSVIERAADMGINYFDTARSYQQGNNERMVGAALKGRRKNLVISTKTGAGTKQQALEHLDTSLKELGTDYVDIWHLHGKSSIEQITDELVDAQQTAKKAGKIRFAGVSTHSNQATLIPALVQKGFHDVILVAVNYTMGADLLQAIEAAHKAGVGIIAMKVMAAARGRGGAAQPPRKPGSMLAALKWVLNTPGIDTAIPSMTDMDQLEENFRAMSQPFTEKDKEILAARFQEIRYDYCRGCNQCAGTCVKGLPVPDMLRYLMYAEGYGQFWLGREHFQQLPREVAAVRCSDCSNCTVRCPRGVRVFENISRAQEVFA